MSRAQLLAAAVHGSTIGRALRAAKLHPIHRGIYATVAPELLTEEGCLVAALLAAGEGALLSHGTAAWRWRIVPAPPSLITLAVPRHREVDGLKLHAGSNLRPGDTTHNGRFPTTTVARTLLDLAVRYDPAPSSARSRKPSSNTTCVPRTWSARCAAGIRAAPTSARH